VTSRTALGPGVGEKRKASNWRVLSHRIMNSFSINGRSYPLSDQPVAVICLDGCADEYLSVSMANGRMPRLAAMARDGYRGLVRGALPSFTNVNNSSIVTGVAPAVHGICGNFFLDPESGEEVMMNGPQFRRCPTLLCAAADAGRKVAFVTAKEKLRTVLGDGLVERGGIAFSTERLDEAVQETHGIENVAEVIGRQQPEIYSGDASVCVLEAGAALLEAGRADFLYLSTTDFMQHKYAPEEEESLEFHAAIDAAIGRLLDAGATVALTADHGMNAKNAADGSPKVIYVESLLEEKFGGGARVICPITDPYVVHHGALGSLVMVHLDDPGRAGEVAAFLMEQDGITEVHDRAMAAAKLELAEDRIGDLVVLSGRDVVVGKRPEDHDLSVLEGGLRSHGGRYEEMVPLVVSRPLSPGLRRVAQGDPRNFDVFQFVCEAAANS
jgi:phosphonoacetate hydrolase